MLDDESWLFLKSGVFSYSAKAAMLAMGLIYTYLIANALGPAEYGKAMFVLAFIGNLVFLFGTEVFGNALTVFTPQCGSKVLFSRFAKILFFGFLVLFAFFYFCSQAILEIIGRGDATLFQYSSLLFLVFPFFLLFEALFKGIKSFGKVLKVSLIEGIANLILATLFVIVLRQGASGTISAKIISVAIAAIAYFYFFRQCRFEEKRIDSGQVNKYLKNTFAMSVFKKLNSQAVLFYMGLFLPATTIGFYYIAEKIATYAIEMPTSALSEAMLPFASGKATDKKALSRLASLSIKFSLLLGAFLGLLALFAGRFLLLSFFPEFVEAYSLLPFFLLLFMGSSINFLTNTYRSINRADILAKSMLLMLAVTLLTGYPLAFVYGVYGLIFSQIIAVVAAFSFLYVKQKSMGLEIEVLPRPKDIRFFASVLWHGVKHSLGRKY
ncbi:MAG: oligosaccharide flippase family protein [Candidatus Diapherotrites archaeon]